MTNTNNTPNWSNTVVRNPGEIVPAGTTLSQLGLPYGGPLFILGSTAEVSDGYHTFGELYARIRELSARLDAATPVGQSQADPEAETSADSVLK